MNRDQYVESLKNKLDEWNEQIGKTEALMSNASGEAKVRFEKQVAEMKVQTADAHGRMQELTQSSAKEWESQRKNFEQAWGDIAAGFGRAWSRFH
jgi:uncharacterized protein YgiM (DUF1202 family)